MPIKDVEAINRLKYAASQGGDSTQAWCKTATLEQLHEGLYHIINFRAEHRYLIESEIATRQHAVLSEHLQGLRKPHWTVFWTFGLVIVGIVIALLAWRFPVQSNTTPISIPVQSASPSPIPVPPTPPSKQSAVAPVQLPRTPATPVISLATPIPVPPPVAPSATPKPPSQPPQS